MLSFIIPGGSPMERKLKGFTIIELLVVITIITVLTAIGVPAALTWVRDARIRDANEEARLIYFS